MIPASVGFQCPECVREGNASVRPVRGGGLRAATARWGTVTLSLIAINVAMFLVTAVSAAAGGASPLDNYVSPVFDALSQVPVLVAQGEWWRLFTAAFLHIGLLHLVFNMLALLVFGAQLEQVLGRGRFLTIYLMSALGGATAIQLFAAPFSPTAGASTGIYGLFGALGVVLIATKQDLRGLIGLLAINLVISFFPGISLIGHLGGLVTGTLTAGIFVLARRRPALQIVGVAVLAVVLLVLAVSGRTA